MTLESERLLLFVEKIIQSCITALICSPENFPEIKEALFKVRDKVGAEIIKGTEDRAGGPDYD